MVGPRADPQALGFFLLVCFSTFMWAHPPLPVYVEANPHLGGSWGRVTGEQKAFLGTISLSPLAGSPPRPPPWCSVSSLLLSPLDALVSGSV